MSTSNQPAFKAPAKRPSPFTLPGVSPGGGANRKKFEVTVPKPKTAQEGSPQALVAMQQTFSMELAAELEWLWALPMRDLQARYVEVWGAPTNSRNRDYLIKRIAWRIQEKEKGGLSDRAKQRLAEVLDESALRIRPPKEFLAAVEQAPVNAGRRKKRAVVPGLNPQPSPLRDSRLPQVGSELRRDYRGQQVVVQVLDQGFLFGTRFYPSLSAIARDVTGQNWNGFLFFGLTTRKEKT